PSEVSALAGGALRRVSHVNDVFLKGIALGPVERFKAKSRDGTMVGGFLVRPPGAVARARLPSVLLIHGGPNGQYSTAFDEEWQMLAGPGHARVRAEPRRSARHA